MKTRPAVIAGIAAIVVLVAIGVTIAITQRDQGGSLASGGRLQGALSLVPADVESVIFVDRDAVEQAAGAALPQDPTDDQLADYTRRLSQMPVTDLDRYLAPMIEGKAAFSALDVEWGVSVSGGEDIGSIYRFRDDLDLGGVADDLVKAGWKAERVDDGTHLTIDAVSAGGTTGLIDDRYPALGFADVTVLPGRHLMVAAMGDHLGTAVRGTLSGDDSLADQDTVAGLVDGTPIAAEIASPLHCDTALSHLSPAQVAEVRGDSGLGALGKPEAAAITVDEDHSVASLAFADAAAASADAKGRRDYLASGSSMLTGQPLSTLISDPEVSADGSVVRATFRMRGAAYRGIDFLTSGGDGPAACGL